MRFIAIHVKITNKIIWMFLVPIAMSASELNCADGSTQALSLGCISERMIGGAVSIVQLLLGLSFVSGWGFIIASIFKFKQVRENPTQVPVSTPFAYMLTAMLLIFIPGLMQSGSVTLFGTLFSEQPQSLTGAQASNMGLVQKTYTPTLSDPSPDSLFGAAARVTEIFPDLMNIIVGSAYIAGLGFAISGMIKLKAVKDNPQQNPVTIPLAYLAIAVLLVFMPSLIAPISDTLFGTMEDVEAGAVGQGSSTLIDQLSG